MYVCICYAVTDSRVRECIESGADTVDAVTRGCRAGGDCGSCHAHIEDMIEDVQERAASGPRLPVLQPSHRAA